MFENKQEATENLVYRLQKTGIKPDLVVAVSSSGVETAKYVSEALQVPFSGVFSTELKAGGEQSPVFGAVSQEGSLWLDDKLIEGYGIDRNHIKKIADSRAEDLRNSLDETQKLDFGKLDSNTVMLVTDGISSGMKVGASLGDCMKNGVEKTVVAAPFISRHAHGKISEIADRVEYVEKPRFTVSSQDAYAQR